MGLYVRVRLYTHKVLRAEGKSDPCPCYTGSPEEVCRGVEEGPWTSNIDIRQQVYNAITMQKIHSIPVVLNLPNAVTF